MPAAHHVRAVADQVARVKAAEAQAGILLWRGATAEAWRGNIFMVRAAAPAPAPRLQPCAAVIRGFHRLRPDVMDL